jgi:soluble lytic murein transglycosylase-like protein
MLQAIVLISLLSVTSGNYDNYGPPLPAETVQLQEFVQKRSFLLQNPVNSDDAAQIAVSAINAGDEYKIDPFIILALIEIESRYDSKAKSKKRCLGLTQMAANTAKGIAKGLGVLKYSLFTINDKIEEKR